MARLRHAATNTTHYLDHESLLGRAQSATVRSDVASVSLHHATLRWMDGGVWEIEDLKSRNGTFVDGQRIAPGTAVALKAGSFIALGTRDNRFDFDDASAPTVMLVPLDGGEPRWPLEELIVALPDPERATYTLFAHPSGIWLLEGPNDTRPLHHGDIVVANDSRWRFSCPKGVDRTITAPALSVAAPTALGAGLGPARDLQLQLRVSADEELVQLSLTGSGQTRELDSRACFYLLLTLARCRLRQGLPKGVRLDPDGWIETGTLTDLLRKSEQHLNIDIYRLRRVCAEIGVLDPSNIVERRGPPRRLRLGPAVVSIAAL
jgi:hypothetical protein